MIKRIITLITVASAISGLRAQDSDPLAFYDVSLYGNGSTGEFAPYYIGSLNYGRFTQKTDALIDACVVRPMDYDRRFSWGAGAEVLGGYFSANGYRKVDAESKSYITRSYRPGAVRLQQLYAEARYRALFLEVGMKNQHSLLLNDALSSGDLVESVNARPIPQVRAGFNDFQDIPFTNGWVQIEGVLAFGKMMDNGYLEGTYNYNSSLISLGRIYNYKRCHFRTNPDKPLSVTVGLQAGGFLGGTSYYYSAGKVVREDKYSNSLKEFLKMVLPLEGNGEDYYAGATLGTWDAKIRYRFRNDAEVSAYFEGIWEDGSGIGRKNKADGLWGIEYKAASQKGWLTGAVIEYIDFRDQSGPIHWDPGLTPGTSVTGHVSGSDNYYNNGYHGAYANYGMSIGTPFLLSPKYNLNGDLNYVCNRANGFHIGAMGNISSEIDYVLKLGYQRGLGTYSTPYRDPKTCFSMMLQARWDASAILPGLSAKVQVAFDAGELRGDNFGTAVSVTYSGKII